MHEPTAAVYREKGTTGPVLAEARQRAEAAQSRWAASVSVAEALLRDRR
jgi:hypothetical protein